jgi:hypothetical protein
MTKISSGWTRWRDEDRPIRAGQLWKQASCARRWLDASKHKRWMSQVVIGSGKPNFWRARDAKAC